MNLRFAVEKYRYATSIVMPCSRSACKTVDQQREIELAVVAGFLRAHRFELILVDHLRVVQQAADQRAFAVVDAAAGEEAQDFLALVLLEIAEDIVRDQIGLVTHRQK